MSQSNENERMTDTHRCDTPPTALPGDDWTCPACGTAYWADDTEDEWGEGTFTWRVLPPEEQGHGRIVLWREGDVDEDGNVRPRYTSDPIPSPGKDSA